jgi:hypothetical protein
MSAQSKSVGSGTSSAVGSTPVDAASPANSVAASTAVVGIGGETVQFSIDVQGAVIRLAVMGYSVVLNGMTSSIEVSTAHGSKISMNDQTRELSMQDLNKNKLVMNPTGIQLTSQGSITLNAAGEVTISGLSIAATAETSLTLEGASSAMLGSSAQTVVKGAMVMIN